MRVQIGDVADFPPHIRARLGVGLLHAGDDTFADVDVDDGFDAAIVDVGRQARVAAAHVEDSVFGSDVLVDDAAQLVVLSIPGGGWIRKRRCSLKRRTK